MTEESKIDKDSEVEIEVENSNIEIIAEQPEMAIEESQITAKSEVAPESEMTEESKIDKDSLSKMLADAYAHFASILNLSNEDSELEENEELEIIEKSEVEKYLLEEGKDLFSLDQQEDLLEKYLKCRIKYRADEVLTPENWSTVNKQVKTFKSAIALLGSTPINKDKLVSHYGLIECECECESKDTEYTYSKEDFYIKTKNARGFKKFFNDNLYSLSCIIPDDSIESYLNDLNAKELISDIKHAIEVKVYSKMPEINICTEIDLKDSSLTQPLADDISNFESRELSEINNLLASRSLHRNYSDFRLAEIEELKNKSYDCMKEPRILCFNKPFVIICINEVSQLPIFIGIRN